MQGVLPITLAGHTDASMLHHPWVHSNRCLPLFPGELWKLACFKKAQWLVQSNVTIPMWWASAYQVHTGPYWENRLMGVFHKRKTVNSKRKVV